MVQTTDFSVLHYVAEVGAMGFLEESVQRNVQDINGPNLRLRTPLML